MLCAVILLEVDFPHDQMLYRLKQISCIYDFVLFYLKQVPPFRRMWKVHTLH